MKTKRRVLWGLAAGGLLASWMFLGVYEDREFGCLSVFVKNRPSPKIYFFAPLGESDTPVSSLPPKYQKEEAAFHAFVEAGGGYYRSVRVWN